MIIAVTIENAHLYGDVIPSMYKLRHQGFKERQDYSVPSYRGMEYDAYDTPGTTYLVWRDNQNTVRGCARLFPTTLPYMIEEIWPELLGNTPIPKEDNIWESSRLCIDKNLPPKTRALIQAEILCGLQEFGLFHNINWMLGVMTPPIWRIVFERSGWPIIYLGDHLELAPKEVIVAGKMPISQTILKSLRTKFSIQSNVISNLQTDDLQKQYA